MTEKSKPNGKPSGSEKLEARIAEVLCSKLHGSALRQDLRKTGVTDQEVEERLNSAGVQRQVRSAMAAYIQEQLPDLLVLLVDQAREKQTWAWKILLDATGLAEALRAVVLAQPETQTSALVSTAFERDLFENIRELLQPTDGKQDEKD